RPHLPVYRSFLKIAERQGLTVNEFPPASDEALQRCLLVGFSDQLARRRDQGTLRCDLVYGRKGELARESRVRKSPLFVASEIQEIQGRERSVSVLLNLATAVEETWLREFYPEDFDASDEVFFDDKARRVIARKATRFRELVLDAGKPTEPEEEPAARLLAEEVAAGRLNLRSWDRKVEKWIERVNCLHHHCPEFGVPAFEEEDRRSILEQVCYGAFSYREIKDRPVWPVLQDWLSAGQPELLDRYVPERLLLPCGRKTKINYEDPASPTVAVRLQELYDVPDKLTLAGGRIVLKIQVLAPNHRPVQVTTDLTNFWQETYPRVKKELQRKYPKHEWR
ncbi:MAG: ATP-dependent helicase C-terminal domain-containing protein, partial [Verrucomicrobiota bacterium]